MVLAETGPRECSSAQKCRLENSGAQSLSGCIIDTALCDSESRKLKLPNRDSAYIPSEKVERYLLSEEHPDGERKAHFLRRMGFEILDANVLIDQLLAIADREEVV